MSSNAIFEMAQKYAIDRAILELETIWDAENRDLSMAIRKRLGELYKLQETLKIKL